MDAATQAENDDPADVAGVGLEPMLTDEDPVIAGMQSRHGAAAAHVMAADMLTNERRDMAQPGSANG